LRLATALIVGSAEGIDCGYSLCSIDRPNWGYSDLAMAHQQNGELQKAADDFKTIIKTDPANKWAKGELDKLQNGLN
jgi:hypothetical protein